MTIDIQDKIDSITSDDYPAWTVLLGIGYYDEDNLLDESEFYDLVIEDKANSISTASLIFVNKDEDDLLDKGIRIYLDGKKKFSGYIKKCSKAYLSNEVSCNCLGLATKIQDESITEKVDLRNIKSSDIIKDHLQPTGFTIEFDEKIGNDFVLNYRLESGNYLQHINNICVLNYWEWWIEETDSSTALATRKLMIATLRGVETPKISFSLEESAYEAIIEKDKEKLKNAILVNGSSSQASNTSSTAAGFFKMGTSATPTAMGSVIGSESYLARSAPSDGTSVTITTSTLKDSATVGDTSLTLNSVTKYPGVGTIQIDDEVLEYSSKSNSTGILNLTSTVTKAHGSGSTVYLVLSLEDVSGYQNTGTVQIDDEKIEYIAKNTNANTLTLSKTLSASHEPDSPVLLISLMRAYVPESVSGAGKVWVGNELIEYSTIDYWGLHDLTRGAKYNDKETPVYAHGDGTRIFKGTDSLTSPDTGSSIGTYGQSDSRVSNIGSADRDGLDKYGVSVLLNSMKYEQFGSINTTVDEISPPKETIEIGDEFYLKEYGSTEKVMRRCMGLKYSGDVVTVTFGLNEEYILNQFDSVNKIDAATYVKQDLDNSKTIHEVSADSSAVKVQLADGTYKWATVR